MAEFVSDDPSSSTPHKIISPHIPLQPIPYFHEIPDFRLPAKIQISGIVREGASRFEVDLKSKEGEFLLHFNPRFNEDCVVRSSTHNGQQWQAEERDGGMPFAPGKPFSLEMMVEESVIVCSVNGSRFCEFAARDDLIQVSSLYVDGDIQMSSLSVVSLGGGRGPVPTDVGGGGGGKGPRETGEADGAGESHPAVVTHPEPHPHEPEPQPQPAHHPHPQPPVSVPGPQGKLPIPYQAPLHELVTTNRMRVVATPHPGAQRFVVNWKSNEGETLFHFNPRFDQNCVVRNATVNHQYPPNGEEREGGACPFQPGKQFALDFLIHGNVVRCFVDGLEFCRFQTRGDLQQVAVLDIHGDLALEQVLIA